MAKTYVAIIGTNGMSEVIWGIGEGEDLESAEIEARGDMERWYDTTADSGDCEFRVAQIDRASFDRVIAGDVSVGNI